MNPWGRVCVWAVLILLLQWWLAPVLALRRIQPDFPLLFVLYLGLHLNPIGAMITGFLMGIAESSLCWTPFGLKSLILVIAGFMPHLFRERLFLRSGATQLAFVVIFSLGADLLDSLYHLSLGREVASGFLERAGLHLAWNVLFFGLLFPVWRRWLPAPGRGYED